MNDWSPQGLWERLRRTWEGWMDEEVDVDDPSLLFQLLFAAPLLIAFVILARH